MEYQSLWLKTDVVLPKRFSYCKANVTLLSSCRLGELFIKTTQLHDRLYAKRHIASTYGIHKTRLLRTGGHPGKQPSAKYNTGTYCIAAISVAFPREYGNRLESSVQ